MIKPRPNYDFRNNNELTRKLCASVVFTGSATQTHAHGGEFERRMLRAGWRDVFDNCNPGSPRTQPAAYFFDSLSPERTARSPLYIGGRGSPWGQRPAQSPRVRRPRQPWTVRAPAHTNAHAEAGTTAGHSGSASGRFISSRVPPGRVPRGVGRAIPTLNATWLREHLSTQLASRRGPRSVMNGAIAEFARELQDSANSGLLGLRLTMAGRLTKQKKGMAQVISRSLGRVPTSCLRARVELSQGFVVTPTGTVGLKVWICYA